MASIATATRFMRSLGGTAQFGEQPWKAAHDDVTRGLVTLADRRHIVPPLAADPGRLQSTELTTERHDARGALDVRARHLPRLESAHVDPLAQEPLDDSGWDRSIRLDARPVRLDINASLLGEAAEVLEGDEALGGSVEAHEEHCWSRCHGLSSSYFTNTQVGWSRGNAMRPMIAVTATSRGLLTFQRNSTTRLASAMSAVSQSPMAILPNNTQAPRMVPMAAAYAPLMKPCTFGFCR